MIGKKWAAQETTEGKVETYITIRMSERKDIWQDKNELYNKQLRAKSKRTLQHGCQNVKTYDRSKTHYIKPGSNSKDGQHWEQDKEQKQTKQNHNTENRKDEKDGSHQTTQDRNLTIWTARTPPIIFHD